MALPVAILVPRSESQASELSAAFRRPNSMLSSGVLEVVVARAFSILKDTVYGDHWFYVSESTVISVADA